MHVGDTANLGAPQYLPAVARAATPLSAALLRALVERGHAIGDVSDAQRRAGLFLLQWLPLPLAAHLMLNHRIPGTVPRPPRADVLWAALTVTAAVGAVVVAVAVAMRR